MQYSKQQVLDALERLRSRSTGTHEGRGRYYTLAGPELDSLANILLAYAMLLENIEDGPKQSHIDRLAGYLPQLMDNDAVGVINRSLIFSFKGMAKSILEAVYSTWKVVDEKPKPRKTSWPVELTLHLRDDGGLRVTSPDLPGLILSGAIGENVSASIFTAVKVLLEYNGMLEKEEGNVPRRG